jgi:hypothetical protein
LRELGIAIVTNVEPDMPPLCPKIEMERPAKLLTLAANKREAVIFKNVVNGNRTLVLGLGCATRRVGLVKLDPDEPMHGSCDQIIMRSSVLRHLSSVRSS